MAGPSGERLAMVVRGVPAALDLDQLGDGPLLYLSRSAAESLQAGPVSSSSKTR